MGRRRAVQLLAGLAIVTLAIVVWVQRSRPLPPPTSAISAVAASIVPATSPLAQVDASPRIVRSVWRFEQQELVAAAPLVVGDLVYLSAGRSGGNGRVLALELTTGHPVWETALASLTDFAPVVAGDLLYAATRAGKLLALNRYTGEELWSFQGRFGIAGPPLVKDGTLFVATDAVYALDAVSGEQRWRRTLSARIAYPMAYADGVLAVLAGGEFVLLDAANGRPLLTFPLWFNPRGGPAVTGDTVAFGGDQASVQALDLHGRDVFGEKTLRFWWTRLWLYGAASRPPLPPGYAWQVRNLHAVAGQLLVGHTGRFYLGVETAGQERRLLALERSNGEIMWQQPLPELVITPVGGATIAGDVLVVGSGESYIGVALATGERRWRMALPATVLAPPGLTGDLLLAPLANQGLYAFEVAAR